MIWMDACERPISGPLSAPLYGKVERSLDRLTQASLHPTEGQKRHELPGNPFRSRPILTGYSYAKSNLTH